MNNTSKKIYNLRTQYSLTQAQLAKIAGVSDKAISAWELGTRDPKIKSIQKICDYFGIAVNSFIDQSTEEYETSKEKPAPVPKDGPASEISDLIDQLTPEQQRLILAQIKGILSNRE